MFAEIRLLVLEGDAAGLAAKVSELSAELRDVDARRTAPATQTGRADRRRHAAGRATGSDERAAPAAHEAPAPLVHSPHS